MKIPYPFKEWQDRHDEFEAAGFDPTKYIICGEILNYTRTFSTGAKHSSIMLKTTNERLEEYFLGPCTLIGYVGYDTSDPSEDAPFGDRVAVMPDTVPEHEHWLGRISYLSKNPRKKFFFTYPSSLRPLQ